MDRTNTRRLNIDMVHGIESAIDWKEYYCELECVVDENAFVKSRCWKLHIVSGFYFPLISFCFLLLFGISGRWIFVIWLNWWIDFVRGLFGLFIFRRIPFWWTTFEDILCEWLQSAIVFDDLMFGNCFAVLQKCLRKFCFLFRLSIFSRAFTYFCIVFGYVFISVLKHFQYFEKDECKVIPSDMLHMYYII